MRREKEERESSGSASMAMFANCHFYSLENFVFILWRLKERRNSFSGFLRCGGEEEVE